MTMLAHNGSPKFPSVFTILCYHYKILEMICKNSLLLFIMSVLMMRFKEEKYGKLCQRKSEIQLLKKC